MPAQPTDTSFTPLRKKRNVAWWIVGLIAMLLFYFVFQLFGPNPPIIISRETTYITEPLGADGLPDYERYIRELSRKGVTPANNAAVLLWQAMWPGGLDAEDYDIVAAELGLEEIPDSNAALEPLYRGANVERMQSWLAKQNRAVDEFEIEDFYYVEEYPWTSEQLPFFAEWIDANRRQLDLLVEGSKRPRFYAPSPTLLNNRRDTLVTMLIPGQQSMRTAAQALSARAMNHVAEGRLSDAWNDVLAMHRIARLVAQGPTLLEQLIALAIGQDASRATVTIVGNDRMTKELGQTIQKDLASLPPFPGIVDCVDQAERLSTLNDLVHWHANGMAEDNDRGPFTTNSSRDHLSINWNIPLVRANRYADLVVGSMRLPPGAAREKVIEDFNAELAADEKFEQSGPPISVFLSRNARSRYAAAVMVGMMVPAIEAATASAIDKNTIFSLTQLATALSTFRAERGHFPEKLDELVPGTLEKLPVDLFHAKPFLYNRLDEGYLLYSSGENGQDDVGSNKMFGVHRGRDTDRLSNEDEREAARDKIPEGSDDIAVSVPTPRFKMPTAKLRADKLDAEYGPQ
jgi:hypothetical protein